MIRDEDLERIYVVAKAVFEGEYSVNEGVGHLEHELQLNGSSARTYIANYRRMREGAQLYRNMRLSAVSFYIEKINKQYGEEGLDKALLSVLKYVEHGKREYPGLRNLVEKYERSINFPPAIELPVPVNDVGLLRLLKQYRERVDSGDGRWLAFVDYIECIYDEIEGMRRLGNADDQLAEGEKILTNYILNGDMDLSIFGRVVAAELLGFMMPNPREVFADLIGNPKLNDEAGKSVLATLAATISYVNERRSKSWTVFEQGEAGIEWLHGLINTIGFKKIPINPDAEQAPSLDSIKTIDGLNPGDCIFRRQSKPLLGNPFRSFGHAGLYIGCIDSELDPKDCASHVVIHVVSGKPACKKVTLQEFCNPYDDGKPEQFWGAYQIDLTNEERQQLLNTAFKYVDSGTYSFTKGYKNGSDIPSFRCDGFVEFCYETVLNAATRQPWSYRKGLFENDTWVKMSPISLRNCLTSKVPQLGGCCAPHVPLSDDEFDEWLGLTEERRA